ncbi:MAG: hypothetical protein ABI409_11330 [Ramlibacter sp.]
MNTTTDEKTLSTADFAAGADRRQRERDTRDMQSRETQPAAAQERTSELRRGEDIPGENRNATTATQGEQLAPLFLPQTVQEFRSRWDEVQIGFVDDPTQAVRRADELVAQVMKNLAETFAHERSALEGELDQSDTEHLRMALRRYRSFFQRLLSL